MTDTPATPPPQPEPAGAEAGAETGAGPTMEDALGGANLPELDSLSTEVDTPAGDKPAGHSIEALLNVDLDVKVVLGDSSMPISTLLKLTRGSVIELDQRIGEPVRVMVNDRTVARGELVKLTDNRIGVSLTEIVREHTGDA
jgi:flagellar motor switch protein FliN/FliY